MIGEARHVCDLSHRVGPGHDDLLGADQSRAEDLLLGRQARRRFEQDAEVAGTEARLASKRGQ